MLYLWLNTNSNYQKGTHLNLIVSVFLILTFLSCASIGQKEKDESLRVINLEIESYKDFILDDTILFNYISNKYLMKSIESQTELSSYLKDEDKNYFLEVLNSKEKNTVNYTLPSNFSIQEDLQLDEVEKFKVKRISLSVPVFSKNLDFVLIAYAYGYKGSMQGGIKKYHLIKGEWQLEQSFNLWVE